MFLLLKENRATKRQLEFLKLVGVQKWFCDAYFFQIKVCWNPYFYSVWGLRAFWAKLSKKGNFGHPPKQKIKFWLIIEKLIFCIFGAFLVLFPFFWPPLLALKPPYLFLLFCCYFFLSLFLIENQFSPWKGILMFIFECLPLFLLSPFWPPPFALSLSLSLSFSCLSSFLSFFFSFFLFLVFVSFFIFASSLLLFHENNNIEILNYKVCFHQSFLIFVGFLSFFFQIPFPCHCFFLILSFAFVQHQGFLQKCKLTKRTPSFGFY